MKGLKIAEKYYREFGAPMLHAEFPQLEGIIAVALCGSGSECYGYDDEISRDHDFEPGFCLFLPDDERIDRKTEFQLERAYAKLPGEYEGLKRLQVSPVGGSRHGVMRMGDFFAEKVGARDGKLTLSGWLSTPEFYLAEATNGAVFRDDEGVFSAIRASLLSMPEDVRKKKLAGHLLMMAQSGQYNYLRILSHGENAAAQLAVNEFVSHAMQVVFLLNRRYMPFYKWSFRALRELPLLSSLADSFEFLLTGDNVSPLSDTKAEVMEDISSMILLELREQCLSDMFCTDLEKHAYSVNDKIEDSDLRTASVLLAV